ncbi:unnamed protein product [Sphagnum balticum]
MVLGSPFAPRPKIPWYRANPPTCHQIDYPNAGQDCNSTVEDLPDWSFSTLAEPESPYTQSRLSSSASAGVYQDTSWNPFDRSFPSFQNSTDNGTFAYENSLPECPHQCLLIRPINNSNLRADDNSYVILSAINKSTQFGSADEDDETPRLGAYRSSSRTLIMQSRQPAWGTSKGSRQNSTTTTKNHNRRKFGNKGVKSPSGRGELHRLRSTVSKTLNSKGARTNHNQVEKQYRYRLNGQFETLLQKLPKEEAGYADGKRVSKVEVLVLAKKHIRELEREEMVLEEENQGLEGSVKEWKRRWVGMGGICMP